MKRLCLTLLMLGWTLAVPADQRTNAPAILKTSPIALTRGLTNEIKVEGINLAGASAVLFEDPAVRGKILHVNTLGEYVGRFIGSAGTQSTIKRGDPPPLNEVTIEVEVEPDAAIGLYRFLLLTKEGTTNSGMLSVEPYYGARPEIEPNDTLQETMLQEDYIFPPAIITGVLGKPGDVDYLPFHAPAGEEFVFHMIAGQLGSKLRWSLQLLDAKGTVLAARSVLGADAGPVLAYRIPEEGKYVLAVSDIQRGGSKDHFYRLKIGSYPHLTGAYPLGVREREKSPVALRGYNLGDQRTLHVEGKPDYRSMARVRLRPEFESGRTHNEIELAVGDYPEVAEEDAGVDANSAMEVAVPVTVNGRISGLADGGQRADEDHFRFRARKGQRYVIEVEARRLGSPLDSVVEVLDSSGKRIPRAAVRALVATKLVLSDRNSAQDGIRLESPNGFEVGDYVMIGNEILRIKALPRTPDDDFRFESFGGQRIGYFDTTPEAHAVDTPAYKVGLHPPDAKLPPNGLPVRMLYYRNDDGGPGYGKDSLLNFTAPADGEYLIRLRDLRGQQGEDFAYRMTIREANPDFRLSVSPPNPSIPRGGGVAVTVDAARLDGFDGAIEVEARDLPPGITATRETIAPGETSTVLVFWADENAALEHPAPLNVVGNARVAGEETLRAASPDDKLRFIALAESADLDVQVEPAEVVLESGGTAKVTVTVDRRNGFEGRVPISVLNLPFGVKVSDVGLNGVLVTEEESSREFTLEALPWVEPAERLVPVTARVETRSPRTRDYAAKPLRLKIIPGKMARAEPAASGRGSTAGKAR